MRRGFTLIEMVFSIALTGLVVGVMATLYGFAAVRLSDAYTRSSLYDQAGSVADRIESTIKSAHSCTLDSYGNLRCDMPENGIDSDGDGHDDTYYPNQIDSNGEGQFGQGRTVWFYNAGSSATYNSGLGNLWRADQPIGSSAAPTLGQLDQSFAYYYGGPMRFPLVTGGVFALDATNRCITFTVTASTGIGAETSSRTGADNSGRTVSITRTVTWRNYN